MLQDTELTRDSILQALGSGKKTSRNKGRAVQIGPVWSSPLAETLMEVFPHLVEDGYSLEDLSQLVQEMGREGSRD